MTPTTYIQLAGAGSMMLLEVVYIMVKINIHKNGIKSLKKLFNLSILLYRNFKLIPSVKVLGKLIDFVKVF